MTTVMTEEKKEIRPHWSYSSINEYLTCPLRYFFNRVDNRDLEMISPHLVLGKALHHVYAHILSLIYPKQDEPINSQEIEGLFSQVFNEAQDNRIHYNGTSYEDWLDKGKSYSLVILEYLIQNKEFNGEELWIERECMVPLITSDDQVLETPITCVFDSVLIDHEEKKVLVTDFKTSSRRFSSDKLEKNLQALFYIYALSVLLGKNYKIDFRFEVLLKQKKPSIVLYEYNAKEKDLDYAIKVIQSVSPAIFQGIFYPSRSFHCIGCGFQNACKDWG